MAVEQIATLKTHFETGDQPTQQQFANALESFDHRLEGRVDLTAADPITFAHAKGGVANLTGAARTGTIALSSVGALLGTDVLVRYTGATLEISGATWSNQAFMQAKWLVNESFAAGAPGLLQIRVINLSPFTVEILQLDELDFAAGYKIGDAPLLSIKAGQTVGFQNRVNPGLGYLELYRPSVVLTAASTQIDPTTNNIPSGGIIRLDGTNNAVELILPDIDGVDSGEPYLYKVICVNATNACRIVTQDGEWATGVDAPDEDIVDFSGNDGFVLPLGKCYEIYRDGDTWRIGNRWGQALDQATADARYYTQAQVDALVAAQLVPQDHNDYQIRLSSPGGHRYGSEDSPQDFDIYTLLGGQTYHPNAWAEIWSQRASAPAMPEGVTRANPLRWDAWSSSRINKIYLRVTSLSPLKIEAEYGGYLEDVSAASFTPADIVGVEHWWRVDNLGLVDGVRLASGLSDSVGGRTMAVTGADTNLAPAWSETEQLLDFEQLDETHLKSTFNVPYTQPCTIIQVVRGSDQLTTTMALWGNGIADGDAGSLQMQGRGGAQDAYRVKDEAGTKGLITYSPGQVNVITTVLNGANGAIYVNKDLILSSQNMAGGFSELVMGAASASNGAGTTTNAMTGAAGDMIFVNGVISTDDLNNVVDYYNAIYNA